MSLRLKRPLRFWQSFVLCLTLPIAGKILWHFDDFNAVMADYRNPTEWFWLSV
jgi:hypothetical protein